MWDVCRGWLADRFTCVCWLCTAQTALNDICHKNKIKFFGTQVFGFFGYLFVDLQKHSFVVEVTEKKGKEDVTKSEKKEKNFVPLATALQNTWKGKSAKRTLNPSETNVLPLLASRGSPWHTSVAVFPGSELLDCMVCHTPWSSPVA